MEYIELAAKALCYCLAVVYVLSIISSVWLVITAPDLWGINPRRVTERDLAALREQIEGYRTDLIEMRRDIV